MAIKNWHIGKIILLWVWGILLAFLGFNILESVEHFVVGYILIGLILGIPFIISVITWKWLSGKEK